MKRAILDLIVPLVRLCLSSQKIGPSLGGPPACSTPTHASNTFNWLQKVPRCVVPEKLSAAMLRIKWHTLVTVSAFGMRTVWVKSCQKASAVVGAASVSLCAFCAGTGGAGALQSSSSSSISS